MIDKYELTGVAANKNAKKFMGNPVNSFLVIKLLTKELQMFFDYFNAIQESKGRITIDSIRFVFVSFLLLWLMMRQTKVASIFSHN